MKQYGQNIIRNEQDYGINYNNQYKNNIVIKTIGINNRKIDGFLINLESKGEIKKDRIEIIYSAICFLSNTSKGVTMVENKEVDRLGRETITFSFEYE